MGNAELTADSAGLPGLPKARLRTSALSNLSVEEIRRAVEPALEEVVSGLTVPLAARDAVRHEAPGREASEVFQAADGLSAWDSNAGAGP